MAGYDWMFQFHRIPHLLQKITNIKVYLTSLFLRSNPIEISVFNTPGVVTMVNLTVKITRIINSCINWITGCVLKIAFWPTVNVNSNLISGDYHFIIVIDRNEKKLLIIESKFDIKEINKSR